MVLNVSKSCESCKSCPPSNSCFSDINMECKVVAHHPEDPEYEDEPEDENEAEDEDEPEDEKESVEMTSHAKQQEFDGGTTLTAFLCLY